MSIATYELIADLDADELFSDSALTGDVVTPSGGRAATGEPLLTMERGHDLARYLGLLRAGSADFLLDDKDGDYDAASTFTAGKQVRVRCTFSGTTYDLLRGILEHPIQRPEVNFRKLVQAKVLGTITRLVGKYVSTALSESIKTGAAIELLLDAADWPKNLPDYVLNDLDNLLGQWKLGESSGVMADTSANANNGTWNAGTAGLRGQAAIDDGGDGSAFFDGNATTGTGVLIGDPAVLREMFAGGGSIAALINISGAGGFNVGRIVSKAVPGSTNLWLLRTVAPSGGNVALEFLHRWSGGEALWRTSVTVPITTSLLVVVIYNSDATANDPTIYTINLSTGAYTAYSVGSGLTETAAPSGTLITDSGQTLEIGNVESGGNSTFHGRIDELALFSDLLTVAEIKVLGARAMNAPRHIDAGTVTLLYWWLDQRVRDRTASGEDALAALLKLVATEGPGAALYEDATGAIVFKDREARVTESRSINIQSTFRAAAGGAEPLISHPYRHDPGTPQRVVNAASAVINQRVVNATAAVWSLGAYVQTLQAGEAVTFYARDPDGNPFKSAVTPVLTTDYTVNSGSISSVVLDRTSGAEVAVTFTAGASGCEFTSIQLRADLVAIVAQSTIVNTIDASTSIASYGTRSYQLPISAEISPLVAQDFCDDIVAAYSDGRASILLTLRGNQNDARFTAALAREVNDRVRVIEPISNVDQECYVESVRHEVLAPATHVTQFTLTAAPGSAGGTLVASGIIIPWPRAASSIPTGWSRVAALDGKYLKGTAAGVDPGATGGATTHTHVDAHAHTDSHTHSGGTSGGYSNAGALVISNGAGGGANDHTHSLPTLASAAASVTGVLTWSTESSEQSRLTVIWIQSDGTPIGIPHRGLSFWNSAALPAGRFLTSLGQGRYLKGAAAAGDGGGTFTAGAHDHDDAGHTHAIAAHTHAAGTTGAGSGIGEGTTTAGATNATAAHTHPTGISGSNSGTSASTASASTATATPEPPYYSLGVIQNLSGFPALAVGDIAIWTGTLANIPAGWALCNGGGVTPDLREKFIKGVTTLAGLGVTGGSVSHTHTAPAAHVHGPGTHTHTQSVTSQANQTTNLNADVEVNSTPASHPHSAPASGAASGDLSSVAATVSTPASTEPPYTEVAFVQYTG